MILSPPDGNSLQFVRVTADGNVDVYKAYREPVAMPGMMGSNLHITNNINTH